MKISHFRDFFKKELQEEYPKGEVGSFFNILAEEYLGMSRLEMALNPHKEISVEIRGKFENALQRLKDQEPIQHIVGETAFFGLTFKVNRHVLIPRPETEELVAWILEAVSEEMQKEIRILDIGTGSGCIAISLAKNLPQAKISAIDVSPEALKMAKSNAILNGVKINFIQQDILEMKALQERYDVIVSNPPYVRELEKKEMQKNVLEHEPASALYVKDEDPLIFYQKITSLAQKSLNPGGFLFFEINQYLSAETESILKAENFTTHLKKDIFGNDRMLQGTLKISGDEN
ncbi:peptide chain release factor N(5)-glutamine methyltransferase [Salinimicrobium sp. GXAS 041]|uniref:peptide chain release factor N(5)-glutamine methyltransferase n=1 Tax=Salinimicrobium sp. GXAS 041 TaxID=3400806 RepID=UPI003C718C40